MMKELAPIALPAGVAMLLGTGAYTDIVGIDAPGSAVAGQVVSITIRIKNNYSSVIGIMAGGALEYGVTPWPTISLSGYKNVNPGATESYVGSFTMPGKDIVIHAYSYYYTTTQGWYFDDERTIKVTFTIEQPVFSNLSVVYSRG